MRPLELWPPPFNSARHAWPAAELYSPLHEDAWRAQQVQSNLLLRFCLPKHYMIKGHMKWDWDGGKESVPAGSYDVASTRRMPCSPYHIDSCNWVLVGIDRIVYRWSIWISWWCTIQLHWEWLSSCSHRQRYSLTWASWQNGVNHIQ